MGTYGKNMGKYGKMIHVHVLENVWTIIHEFTMFRKKMTI
jgi:hypothetical protein